MDAISSDELRKLVREVLRDVAPVKAQATPFAAILRTALGGSKPASVAVDDDLSAFARDIAAACDDADLRAAIRDGKIQFQHRAPQANGAELARGTYRIDKGLLSETAVIEAARSSSRIVLGRGVAVTPLARDKARELRIELVRDKP